MSADPIEVVWTSKGLKNLEKDLDTVSQRLDDLGKKWDNLGGIGRGGGGGGRSGGSGKGSGGGSKKPLSTKDLIKPVPKVPGLPSSATVGQTRQERLVQLIQQANAAGNTTAAARLQAQLNKINSPNASSSFSGRLQSLISSTRIGGKGGLGGAMPLVGRLTALLGEGAEGGPIGLIAASAVAAATALQHLATNAAETAAQFSALGFKAGGNGAETAALRSYGNAIGMDPSAIGGLAESFHNRITGDVFGRTYAQRLGINPGVGGPIGEQDYAKELLRAIEGLRKITDRTERIRVARATGLEGALPLTNLSNRQFSFLGKDQEVAQRIFDPQFQQNAADFQAAIGRAKEAADNLEAAIGKVLLPAFTELANGIANATNKLAAFANDHPDFVKGALATNPLTGPFALTKMLYDKLSGAGANDSHTDAVNRNTDALNRNTSAQGGTPGFYGNGARAGNALVPGMTGESLRRALEQDGFRTGPY